MEYHSNGSERRRVGLVYDERMWHSTPKSEIHPENPDRIRAVWNKLTSAGIPQRCMVFDAKAVEDQYIAAVHTNNHINLIKTISSKKMASKKRNRVAAKYDSIYFNEGSSESAYLAAGSVLKVAEKVAKGELTRPLLLFDLLDTTQKNVNQWDFAYLTMLQSQSFLLNQKELGINKILIVDWDVHHGNGTQQMFWNDSQVLVFSVHRHENGSFYPTGDDGSHIMIGEGPGAGYNINVPWENDQCGDADYIAVWDHILIPVAREFNPDIIIISTGFDAALSDPLGGCCVTPHGCSVMFKKLMKFSGGKIIMALEGGCNIDSLANSVVACVEVLLEDKPIAESVEGYPFESTWRVIKAVREELSAFWPVLVDKSPEELVSRVTPEFVPVKCSDPVPKIVNAEQVTATSQRGKISDTLTFSESLDRLTELRIRFQKSLMQIKSEIHGIEDSVHRVKDSMIKCASAISVQGQRLEQIRSAVQTLTQTRSSRGCEK